MFGFGKEKAQQAEVLSHWYTPVPNFTTSTQEFYTKVEQEIKAQEVPGLKVSRVEFSEGGFFSAKRQYLRLIRDELVFDICAAPFGVNYFFSCRFAALPQTSVIQALLTFILGLFFQKLNLRLLEPYYKEDTRLMYLTVVEGVVKKLVEQETAAKGIKLLDQYENAPILGGLYKNNRKVLEQPKAEVTAK